MPHIFQISPPYRRRRAHEGLRRSLVLAQAHPQTRQPQASQARDGPTAALVKNMQSQLPNVNHPEATSAPDLTSRSPTQPQNVQDIQTSYMNHAVDIGLASRSRRCGDRAGRTRLRWGMVIRPASGEQKVMMKKRGHMHGAKVNKILTRSLQHVSGVEDNGIATQIRQAQCRRQRPHLWVVLTASTARRLSH